MATQATRTYRHRAPKFKYSHTRNILAKRVMSAVERHDFMRNPAISKLWSEGGFLCMPRAKVKYIEPRSYRMRKDCEETMKEVMKALIYRADLSDSDEYFLEVKASARQIAADVDQLHTYEPDYNGSGQYRHGRYTYDPVKARLHDLEAAKIIIAQREYCRAQKRYLATRYWLTPEFFMHLGVTRNELIRMVAGLRKASHKNTEQRNASEKRRLIRDSRLQESIKPAIKRFLTPMQQINAEINALTKPKKLKVERPRNQVDTGASDSSEGGSKRAFICGGGVIGSILTQAKQNVSDKHPNVDIGTDKYYCLLYDAYVKLMPKRRTH